MTRKLALEIIKVEYRQHGRITPKILQVYTESGISWKTVTKTVNERYLA